MRASMGVTGDSGDSGDFVGLDAGIELKCGCASKPKRPTPISFKSRSLTLPGWPADLHGPASRLRHVNASIHGSSFRVPDMSLAERKTAASSQGWNLLTSDSRGTLEVSIWHPLYEPFLDLTFRYSFTILREFRCTTRAKNDGLRNARRGPSAGTATYFDSYPIHQTIHQTNGWRSMNMACFLSFDAFLNTFCDGLREQRIERQKFEEKLKTVESQLSDASHEQEEVKKLLEDFAAYTLANVKAFEVLVQAVLDDLEAWRTLKERMEAATASSGSQDNTAEGKAVEKKNRLGRTELHNAVCSGDKDYVQQLLENRASVDATDRSGRTPLHLAASEVSEPAKIIELLLEARARTDAEDLSGFTPLNLACDSKCKEAVAVLQRAEDLSKVAEGMAEDQIGTEAPLDVLHFLPKHMPAVASDANEITFEGNIMPGAQQCWTSFPGKFKAGWDALVNVPAFGDSVACVFLCDSQSGLGEHKKDPKGDGKKCYCYRIYGERRDEEYKRFGYVIYVRKKYSECSDLERKKLEQKANTMDAELVFEDDDSSAREAKEKRAREKFAQKKTAAFGCSWYDLWFQRVREAVQRGQRLKVVFFPGEAMEGRVDMDALATADLWNGVGLGTSQKCEVATLEAMRKETDDPKKEIWWRRWTQTAGVGAKAAS
eukprot:s442_g11.t1